MLGLLGSIIGGIGRGLGLLRRPLGGQDKPPDWRMLQPGADQFLKPSLGARVGGALQQYRNVMQGRAPGANPSLADILAPQQQEEEVPSLLSAGGQVVRPQAMTLQQLMELYTRNRSGFGGGQQVPGLLRRF